jgi:hypothetical protein
VTDYMTLQMWTVYEHPLDHPDGYVARLFNVGRDGAVATDEVIMGDTLQAVRSQIPQGLFCMVRSPDDEPQIVETWF